jgi:hypothetical protein
MSSQMAHTETMSARERVVKALNHEEPDRVPIDLGGFQTGIHKKAYQSLINYLGLEETFRSSAGEIPCRRSLHHSAWTR